MLAPQGAAPHSRRQGVTYPYRALRCQRAVSCFSCGFSCRNVYTLLTYSVIFVTFLQILRILPGPVLSYIFAGRRERVAKAGRILKDTLIKSTSLSASRLPVKVVMLVSMKSAEKIVDSGRWGRDAPFGRLRGARWLCHSSLCGGLPHRFVIPCQRTPRSL